MRAVARAHLATGCPITVHTHPGTHQGLTVQRVMGEEGVEPGRVVLGHSGDSMPICLIPMVYAWRGIGGVRFQSSLIGSLFLAHGRRSDRETSGSSPVPSA